ncbi:hypothetical protein [Streptomyces sp. SAS_270]|uniref:hypothetical protein n=1 Tax=Streptomyces sp. SAS_270 TaxID=3412748 RepID=UPI00403C79D1
MGSLRLALCAGAAAAAALTPTAYAADTAHVSDAFDAGVSVTPASPAPGSDIQLLARGCAGRTGTATSGAFVTDAQLTGAARADGTLVGETRVRSSLPPGTYDIKVGCDGRGGKVTGRITVPGPPSSATASALSTPSAPVSPVAPVDAGGGGTAHLDSVNAAHAVDARNAGPGTRQAVIGLILASVAAIAVAARGARRNRDVD